MFRIEHTFFDVSQVSLWKKKIAKNTYTRVHELEWFVTCITAWPLKHGSMVFNPFVGHKCIPLELELSYHS